MKRILDVRTLVSLAVLTAFAYAAMFFFRFSFIPAAPFLRYDPKDIIIVTGGFLFGPLPALLIALSVSFLEMVTVSVTGFYGFIMNFLSSCAFACTAAAIYRARKTLPGAVIGLVAGVITATAVMLLWNYLIVPLYTEWERAVVAARLAPIFLPFNLIKYSLNAGIAVVLYKPLKVAMKMAGLIPVSSKTSEKTGVKAINVGLTAVSLFIVLTCVLIILAYRGVI